MAPIRSKLMEISYSDPKFQIRLTGYADTVIIDSGAQQTISAIRFGGYPEVVRALSDAIYGGASVELKQDDTTLYLDCRPKGYRRILSHDGIYAVATLMANDDSQTEENPADNCDEDAPENPRKCYIFCPPGDRASLFAEVDRKTAAPLIPEFQDYVLDSLIARGDLRQMKVLSFTERMEAWSLTLLPEDRNVTDILEQGLKDGRITIPGAIPDAADGFAEVNSVTSYLNTFGVTVADRIRSQFVPKFDPASEPLSEEILEVNDYIHEKAGYSLYDAQLAVTEAVKRQLCQQKMALIVAECGSGKTKLSAAATGALNALKGRGTGKSFNLVMCPSHVTGKWVREIAETLPDMAELYGICRKFIGMTATLINGYSSGIFHLLYRIVPGLMQKDGKSHDVPSRFDAEYGVVENTYEITDADYNSNRRSAKSKKRSRQLPGVSPLVFSRFLLECTAFLSLSDMGKDLPDYEEIPIPLTMPKPIEEAYKEVERELTSVLRNDRKAANKILSAYLNLLTVYPDQPYDQPEIIHPISGCTIVKPEDMADFQTVLPKEEKVLEIVRAKIAAGERVMIYTSWTRTDTQRKLLGLLREEGIRTEILSTQIVPEKREDWLSKRLSAGTQVIITNPKCVETGLDLNAFTTLIFYSMGYNLFTLRQASRRSWRINQTAPRVEVYMLYYADTMQAKAMKLMASKLAVAGLIEGTFSEEGLAAMSDVQDMTSQMAKELMLGIKDNVEDIAATFKKMAIINPHRAVKQLPESVTIQEERVVEVPQPESVRAADTAARQVLYDGLLQASRTGRKPKHTELEDQLSMFDTAA